MSNSDPTLLHDLLVRSAERLPEKIAIVCEHQRKAYADIDGASNSLAHSLVEAGVERGDRVVVFAENGLDAVISFWGVLKANAVVCMVSPSTKSDKLAYLLHDCRASALIGAGHLSPVFVPASRTAGSLRAILVSGECEVDRAGNPPLLPLAEALSFRPQAPPPRRSLDVDLASIIYTSGSTGEPKGVMLTHRNMLAAAKSITTYLQNVEDDVILDILPLSFDYGLYQMIMAARVGGRLVLDRSFAYPTQVLRAVVEERVTGFPGVPTVFALLSELGLASRYDFSSIRYVTNTAAALTQKHISTLKRLFPQARIYSMYGLTECKRCTYLPPEDLGRKPGSVGIAIPNTELWIVDQDDRRVGPNVTGQLVIRGATVMAGYWEKPEATRKRLRPGPVPGESVLYTGDLCRLDEEGYLYYVGRMDDIIKSRGEKVAPKEVENAIMNMATVREVAVIGVPDEILGQAVKAFVVLEQGAGTTEKDVILECQRTLESYMVPKYVELIEDLPRTATGKIDKKRLS